MILYIGEIFRYVRIFVSKTNDIAAKNCVRPLSLKGHIISESVKQLYRPNVKLRPLPRPDCRKGTIAVDL